MPVTRRAPRRSRAIASSLAAAGFGILVAGLRLDHPADLDHAAGRGGRAIDAVARRVADAPPHRRARSPPRLRRPPARRRRPRPPRRHRAPRHPNPPRPRSPAAGRSSRRRPARRAGSSASRCRCRSDHYTAGRPDLGRHVRDPARDREAGRHLRRDHRRPGLERDLGRRRLHRLLPRRASPSTSTSCSSTSAASGCRDPIQCPEATGTYYASPRGAAGSGQGAAAGEAAPDLRRRLPGRGEGPRRRPAAVRHDAGDRGPRGDPRLPRRRQDGPLRRELRHAVRPDVRRRPTRSTSRRCTSTGRST